MLGRNITYPRNRQKMPQTLERIRLEWLLKKRSRKDRESGLTASSSPQSHLDSASSIVNSLRGRTDRRFSPGFAEDVYGGTYTYPHRFEMGARNISISDEAYSRLLAMKRSGESFTDVVNRLAGKRSILELAGILTPREAEELRLGVREIRKNSTKRVRITARRLQKS